MHITLLRIFVPSNQIPYPSIQTFSFHFKFFFIPAIFLQSLSLFLSPFTFLLFVSTVESNCWCSAQRIAQRHISLVRTYVTRMQAEYAHHSLRNQARRIGKQTCFLLFLYSIYRSEFPDRSSSCHVLDLDKPLPSTLLGMSHLIMPCLTILYLTLHYITLHCTTFLSLCGAVMLYPSSACPCSYGGRSVSPPVSRRAVWKSTADEDIAYR